MRYNRIFLLFLLCGTLLFYSCRTPAKEREEADPFANSDTALFEPEAAKTPISSDGGSGEEQETEQFLSSLTFLGDSTTAHMRQRAPIRDSAKVWATKSRYLNLDSKICNARIEDPYGDGELLIAEAAARYRPEYLLITLGIDYGVYYYRDAPEKFRLCYEKLLKAIETASPDTKIILGAIFPVAGTSAVITNQMVDQANAIIKELAAAHGLSYVDNNTILKNEAGLLREEYCYSEDGIHLTEAAYKAIFQNLERLAPTLR